MLTTFDLDEYAFAALQAGASGFLLKDALPEDLLRAIRAVHAGDAVVAPSTTSASSPGMSARGVPAATSGEVDALTDREREVWLAIARGLTNGEIADELGVSEATVKTHVGNILSKTGMRDRVALVVLAYETGAIARRLTAPPHPVGGARNPPVARCARGVARRTVAAWSPPQSPPIAARAPRRPATPRSPRRPAAPPSWPRRASTSTPSPRTPDGSRGGPRAPPSWRS